MKKAFLVLCGLYCMCCVTFISKAQAGNTTEVEIVEEKTASEMTPNIFAANTDKTYTYAMMQSDIVQMTSLFPKMLTYQTVGKTIEGRDIYLLILGNKEAEHAVFVQASIHGREYITTQLVMHMLLNYMTAYEMNLSYKKMLDDVCFYIVPMSNPDGVSISQLGEAHTQDADRLEFLRSLYKIEKKSRQSYDNYLDKWKANANGVDINRNFDAGWYGFQECTHCSSEKYKGALPGTEAETIALMTAFQQRDFDCVLNYHARGEVIYYGALNISAELFSKSKALAQLVSNVNNYTMIDTTCSSSCVSGGFGDWVMMVENTPSVAIEVGKNACPVPQWEFASIWLKNYNMWPVISEYVKK